MRYRLYEPGAYTTITVGARSYAVGDVPQPLKEEIKKLVLELPEGEHLQPALQAMLETVLSPRNDTVDVESLTDDELLELFSRLIQELGLVSSS